MAMPNLHTLKLTLTWVFEAGLIPGYKYLLSLKVYKLYLKAIYFTCNLMCFLLYKILTHLPNLIF